MSVKYNSKAKKPHEPEYIFFYYLFCMLKSIVAATNLMVMRILYLGLGKRGLGPGNGRSTSFVGGSKGHSSTDILWNMLVAIGDVALASGYAQIAIDIQV